MIRRALVVVLGTALLAACGSTVSETPQQVVTTASQKMADLKSTKFDIDSTLVVQLPAALVQSLGSQGAALQNLNVGIKGTGQAQLPDKVALSLQAKVGGVTVTLDAVMAGGKLYLKDPTTGQWTLQGAGSSFGQLSQINPNSAKDLLSSVQTIKDLGDTQLAGVTVHHYELVPDKGKLAAQLSGSGVDPQTLAMVKTVIDKGTVHIEVWIGKDDHLMRRASESFDGTIDLSQLAAAAGASASAVPAGATMHLTENFKFDFHDFNSTVTVTVPSVSPS